jgi:hypothetical protein
VRLRRGFEAHGLRFTAYYVDGIAPSRKSIHRKIRSRKAEIRSHKAQSSTNSQSSANSPHRYTSLTCLLVWPINPTLSLTSTRLASSFVCLIVGRMSHCVIHRIFNSPWLMFRELSVT